jgi:NB-ARC domain
VWVDKDNDKQKNKEIWMKFFAPLKISKSGSSVLVTTRLRSVVEMLGSTLRTDFQGLSRKESCYLFRSHAFPSGISGVKNMEELWKVGEKIITKLKGSPLALKVAGGQLSNNYSVKEWTKVLENALSDKVMDIIKLSYDHLPSHLKLCFAYCTLFPTGYNFTDERVNQLIHMWIAQGFVCTRNYAGNSLEDLGRHYFNDLCSRSFFHPIKGWNEIFYGMHDLYKGCCPTCFQR